jgi:hypothetical protein
MKIRSVSIIIIIAFCILKCMYLYLGSEMHNYIHCMIQIQHKAVRCSWIWMHSSFTSSFCLIREKEMLNKNPPRLVHVLTACMNVLFLQFVNRQMLYSTYKKYPQCIHAVYTEFHYYCSITKACSFFIMKKTLSILSKDLYTYAYVHNMYVKLETWWIILVSMYSWIHHLYVGVSRGWESLGNETGTKAVCTCRMCMITLDLVTWVDSFYSVTTFWKHWWTKNSIEFLHFHHVVYRLLLHNVSQVNKHELKVWSPTHGQVIR